jgi:hypothetical protein
MYFKQGASHVPGTAQEMSPDGSSRALCRGRCLPEREVDPVRRLSLTCVYEGGIVQPYNLEV